MASYQVDSRSRLTVRARSSIHDTTTTWRSIRGTVEADPDRLADDGATATFTVDMTAFDAGDWLKNRKLGKDLAVARYPEARFELTGLRDVQRTQGDRFSAIADGVLRWRGREVALAVVGEGTLTAEHIAATGRFDLDIQELGVKPPRFLMFKVESEVTVEVTLEARAAARS